jgi:hypothetical protein
MIREKNERYNILLVFADGAEGGTREWSGSISVKTTP